MKFIGDRAKTECADEVFDKEYRIIANEIKELKRAWIVRKSRLAESYEIIRPAGSGIFSRPQHIMRFVWNWGENRDNRFCYIGKKYVLENNIHFNSTGVLFDIYR